MRRALAVLLVLFLLAALPLGAARKRAAAAPAPQAQPSFTKGGTTLSMPMQILIGMTLLTLLPAAVMSVTPFLRIVVVLHFLRQALGTQTVPSNQIMVGLALFLALLIMQPVVTDIYHNAWQPMDEGKITPAQAFDTGSAPLKTFLARFAREKDVKLFVEIAKAPQPRTPADLDLRVLVLGLHPVGAQGGLPDWRRAVPAVPGD